MAIRLSEMKSKVATTVILWDDEKVDVGYKPAAFTIEVAETVAEAAGENNMEVVAQLLEPILEWWDVLDDDGERLPTDRDMIRTMPIGFLMAVMDQVSEAMRPPASEDSDDG